MNPAYERFQVFFSVGNSLMVIDRKGFSGAAFQGSWMKRGKIDGKQGLG